MSDFNFNFLKFGKNDKQISLDSFSGELKKDDIKDKKLLKLFDFFDTDKSGVLDAEEVKTLWNNVVEKANSDGNSIFEKDEAKEFLEQTVNENGESIRSLGVNFKDMFKFLNALNDKKIQNADINNPDNWEILPAKEDDVNYIPREGFNELENLLNDTSDDFINYLKTEGCISHFINAVRIGKKQTNREDVEAALAKVAKDLEFLKAAYEGRLICGDKKIDFESAYKTLMGVEYSEENIKDCNEKSEKYAKANAINTMVNSLIDELQSYSQYRDSSGKLDLMNPAKFNKSFLTLFSKLLNIQDKGQINAFLAEFCEKYKDNPILKKYGGEIQLMELGTKDKQYYGQDFAILRKSKNGCDALPPELMQLLAEYTINEKLVPVKSALLGLSEDATNEDCEKYVAQCKQDYEDAFKTAYGTQELSTLLDEYIQGQQNGMQVVNIASAVAMMTATIFTGGAANAVIMGIMVAQPVELIEKLTNGDGATWKDLEDHGYQILKSLPWMGLGMAGGKLGDMARAACKLKGLQSVANRTGKSLEQLVKEIGENKLSTDALKILKQAQAISKVAGFSTEVGVDLVTTKMFQKEGVSEADWVMAFVGALQGTVMQKKLAGMGSKNEQIKYLQTEFKKGNLDLTADEAKMIIDKMVDTNNLPTILDEAGVSAAKKGSQKPKMGIDDTRENVVDVQVADNGTFAVKIGESVFIAKDLDEVKQIIQNKAPENATVNYINIRHKDNIYASQLSIGLQQNHKRFYYSGAHNNDLEYVKQLIHYVCQKYGYDENMLYDICLNGTNHRYNIFKNEETLCNYLNEYDRLYRTYGTDTFGTTYYNYNAKQLEKHFDLDLLQKVAMINSSSDEIKVQLDRACYLLQQGRIDKLSFENLVRDIEVGYISPNTVDLALSSGLINNHHFKVENLYDSNPITRDVKQNRKKVIDTICRFNPEINTAIKTLKKSIGNDIYNIKWEVLQNNNITTQHIYDLIEDIQNIKYLKQTEVLPENFYIKIKGFDENQTWAMDMSEIANYAAKLIEEGYDFDIVMSEIAKQYRQVDLNGMLTGTSELDRGKAESGGALRCQKDGYFCDESLAEEGAITPFSDSDSRYHVYSNKFYATASNELTNPYAGIFDLTRIELNVDFPINASKYNPNNPNHIVKYDANNNPHYYAKKDCMAHPKGKYAGAALELVNQKQQSILADYKGKKLSKRDINDINERIGEIHWILSHSMPWGRGSAGISDVYVKSLYKSLGIKVSGPKTGISYDLEAFCTELDDYKKNYKNLYETEPYYVD